MGDWGLLNLIDEYGVFGTYVTMIYIVVIFVRSIKHKEEDHSFTFKTFLVYYIIFFFLTAGIMPFRESLNLLWFVPILISGIYEYKEYKKRNKITIKKENKAENKEKDKEKKQEKVKEKNSKALGIVTVLVIVFVLFSARLMRLWYSGGDYIIYNIIGDYYTMTKDYDKAADTLFKVDYTDEAFKKVEKAYEEGTKYYYERGEYRKCIDFIKKFDKEYRSSSRDYYSPWRNIKVDYRSMAYKDLYNQYKENGDRQNQFDLMNEIKGTFEEKKIKSEGYNFNDDFNKYECFLYLNDNSSVTFGKYATREDDDIEWKLLYKEDNYMYLFSRYMLYTYPKEVTYVDPEEKHRKNKNRKYDYYDYYEYTEEDKNEIENEKYKDTDLFRHLNVKVYNSFFNEDEKSAMLNIDEREKVSLLDEDMVNYIKENRSENYLSDLYGKSFIWLKSDIEDGKMKALDVYRYSSVSITKKDATLYPIYYDPLLLVIKVDLDEINELAKIEREKQNEEKRKEEIRKEEERLKRIKEATQFDIDFSEKINAMKTIGEYPDYATVEDFDSIQIGKDYMEHPILWILLEKKDGKALLLSKYSPYHDEYNLFVDNEHMEPDKIKLSDIYETFTSKDDIASSFKDYELNHVLETEVIFSKNDKYSKNNDLSTINTKWFFLGIDQIKKYFSDKDGNLLKNKLKTVCSCNSHDDYYTNEIGWWLKDMGEPWWTIACIEEDGGLNEKGVEASYPTMGYRIAMWVKY